MSTPVPSLFFLSTASYLTLQALPLLITPSLISSLLTTSSSSSYDNNPANAYSSPHPLTQLESHLARTQAYLLLAYTALLLLLSGIIPTSTSSPSQSSSSSSSDTDSDTPNPYAYPTTVLTTLYHGTTAFHAYTYTLPTSSPFAAPFSTNFGYTAATIISTALFCMGTWVVLFDGDKGHWGKRSHTDKRTSGWPFGNSGASSEIKKRRRRAEAEGKTL